MFWSVPPQYRAMLPQARLRGPTPWVLALLMLLTMLAAAAGISLAKSAQAISGSISGRVTVQIITANPELRSAQAAALRRAAAEAPFVASARTVERGEMLAIMGRWFGSSTASDDPVIAALPLPALVDIDLLGGDQTAQMNRLQALVAQTAPGARVIPHAEWLEPVARLIRLLAILALALVALMALASAAIVIMTARAAVTAHFATIEILHLIGATDHQICRLFQRRILIDSAYGIILGAAVAAAVLLAIALGMGPVTAGLATGAQLGPVGWASLLILPLFAIALAGVAARFALFGALKQIL